jgi:hypothetical protein
MQKFHMDRDHASHTSIRDIPVRKLRQKTTTLSGENSEQKFGVDSVT